MRYASPQTRIARRCDLQTAPCHSVRSLHMADQSIPSPEFLLEYRPCQRSLLANLGQQMTHAMVRHIAESEWGIADADEHFAALVRIRDHFDFESPIRWAPSDVLMLTTYIEPDTDERFRNEVHRRNAHVERAFACASLLVAGADEASNEYLEGENQSVIPLTLSAMALGADTCNLASRFLAWRLLGPCWDELELPFLGLALLMLQRHLHPAGYSCETLDELCDWIMQAERIARAEHRPATASWLLGLSPFTGRHGAWQAAAKDILIPHPGMPKELTQRIANIRTQLTRNQLPHRRTQRSMNTAHFPPMPADDKQHAVQPGKQRTYDHDQKRADCPSHAAVDPPCRPARMRLSKWISPGRSLA